MKKSMFVALTVAAGLTTGEVPAAAAEPAVKTDVGPTAVETLDRAGLLELNQVLDAIGVAELPASTKSVQFEEDGDLVARSGAGWVVAERDAIEIDRGIEQNMQCSEGAAANRSGVVTLGWGLPDWDWGKVLRAGETTLRVIAKSIAGCAGGMIGIEAIQSILEKRVSAWSFTKWLGGKIGWGSGCQLHLWAMTTVFGWN